MASLCLNAEQRNLLPFFTLQSQHLDVRLLKEKTAVKVQSCQSCGPRNKPCGPRAESH